MEVGQHLDLQGLNIIEATEDVLDEAVISPDTVRSEAAVVEAPKPAEGVKVKLANGTIRTDF